jgi:hypothetical protein
MGLHRKDRGLLIQNVLHLPSIFNLGVEECKAWCRVVSISIFWSNYFDDMGKIIVEGHKEWLDTF